MQGFPINEQHKLKIHLNEQKNLKNNRLFQNKKSKKKIAYRLIVSFLRLCSI